MRDARGPLPRWLAPLAWPMARVYSAGVAWRNARFDRSEGVRSLAGTPVISVGNLSAGGTGKSPFVAWCAGVVADRGAQPVIALRGYRATTVDGSGALISDEAVEYARSAPTARVVVGARRFEALSAALGASDADSWRDRAVVFLDDGFQHRQVARSLDIVLVDATRPALDGDVLPRGWLREPARNIARADIVVVTKAHATDARARAASLVARFRGRAHDAVCEHVWRSIDVVGEATSREVAWLAGKRVLSACALGNPAHFHGMVERATGVAPALLSRRDHASFSVAELAASAQRAGVDVVVLSRKDIVKLDARTLSARGVTVVVPNLGLHFLEGEDRVRDAIARACDALRATVSAPGAPSSG